MLNWVFCDHMSTPKIQELVLQGRGRGRPREAAARSYQDALPHGARRGDVALRPRPGRAVGQAARRARGGRSTSRAARRSCTTSRCPVSAEAGTRASAERATRRRRQASPAGAHGVVPHRVRNLKDAIVTGSLRPMERITENEVAARYGPRRTPVREAFRRLEAEGLIQVVPQRGQLRVAAERGRHPRDLPDPHCPSSA